MIDWVGPWVSNYFIMLLTHKKVPEIIKIIVSQLKYEGPILKEKKKYINM